MMLHTRVSTFLARSSEQATMLLATGVHGTHSLVMAAAAEPSLQSSAASCLGNDSTVGAVLIERANGNNEEDDHA